MLRLTNRLPGEVVPQGGFLDHPEVQASLRILAQHPGTFMTVARPLPIADLLLPFLALSKDQNLKNTALAYRYRLAAAKPQACASLQVTSNGWQAHAEGLTAIVATSLVASTFGLEPAALEALLQAVNN